MNRYTEKDHMKNYILKPQIKEDLVIARLPQGVESVSVCYVTSNPSPNQRPSYESQLEIGHDFQIRNGSIVSRKVEVIGDSFILIETEQSSGKKCKACRKDDQSGSFCSSCGQFLF